MTPATWKPNNYSTPNWVPLELFMQTCRRPVRECGAYMWMYADDGGVEHYKHRDTRAYLQAGPVRPRGLGMKRSNATHDGLVVMGGGFTAHEREIRKECRCC
jgi:hypothetical protein